jgi:hypothetical protein
MPWYIFIHPIWQLIALYLGVKNLSVGFNKSRSWTFPLRSHRNNGLSFIIMTSSGAIVGWIINSILARYYNPLHIIGHRIITYVMLILLILITISGFMKQKHAPRLSLLQFLHPWFGVLATGLIFAQLFLAVTKIFNW